MRVVKIFTYIAALLIAICAIIQYVDLGWWRDNVKSKFSVPKKEHVEINTYKDKKGVVVITDKPVPEEYQNESEKTGSYSRESHR
jgi:hypothetical protein